MEMEMDRIERVIVDSMRGLYFHETGDAPRDPLLVCGGGPFAWVGPDRRPPPRKVIDSLQELTAASEVRGENQRWVWWTVDQKPMVVRLCVYSTFDFWLLDKPDWP